MSRATYFGILFYERMKKELADCEIELDDDGYCSVHYDAHIDQENN